MVRRPTDLSADHTPAASLTITTRPASRRPHARSLTTPLAALGGLIDHVAIDIVPVVFGRGKPYFGTLANGHLMLDDPEVVIQGDGVLHVRYPVHRGR
jgi:hypothetical protein